MDGVTMATQSTESGKQPRTRAAAGDDLAIIAQRAQAFTNASGVAIALAEGDSTDEIVCRARSGASAPDVGAALRVQGTFTGLCIQTGKELRCDDAETDTRVDMTAIRALGIRSMVVTPIREDNKVIGVLAVFAPSAHAFTITHVAVLKTMADQISAAVLRERRAREDGASAEPAPQYAPVAMAKPAVSVPAAPAPVLIKPAASANSAPAVRTPVPPAAKVEPIKVRPAASDSVSPVPFPKREERPEVRASFGTFDAVAGEEKQSGGSRMIVGAAVVLVIAAVSVFGVMKMRKPSQGATQQTPVVNPAPQGQPGDSAPLAGTSVPVIQPSAGNSTGNANTVAAVPSRSAADSVAVAAKKNDNGAAKPGDKPNAIDKTVAPDKTEKVAPKTVALASGPSHIAGATSGAQGSAEVSTTLSVGGNSSAGTLSALAQPASESRPTAVMAQSTLEPLVVVRSVPPVYPAIAKARSLTTTVVVEVKVGKDGKVSNPKLISGLPIFRDAAFDAVKQWVFKPAKLNGQPIEQTTQISLKFNP
ncbi:MAG: TonB family protein [Acidobacteriia bacterium]|nr:TonB family protein [Terriglobia bacterium]